MDELNSVLLKAVKKGVVPILDDAFFYIFNRAYRKSFHDFVGDPF